MSNNNQLEQLNQWFSEIKTNLPILTKPQAYVLALLSFGMTIVRSSGLSSVVNILTIMLSNDEDKRSLERKRNSLRQRLRQWCYSANDKTGTKRSELNVKDCFPFLLKWVIKLWRSKQLALALDATTIADRFTILVVSVLYRGCAIPVAWTIMKGNEKQSWRQEWLVMLRLIKPGIPNDFIVIVLSDRGLYATWLFNRIKRLGWHPFMRKSVVGTFRPDCWHDFHPISSFAKRPQMNYSIHGTLFKTKDRRLKCTLLVYWDEESKEPWFIITDISSGMTDASWYRMRVWIEQCFKLIKRGFWQWHRTRMRDPERAERIWLAISVATLWLLSVGGEAEANAEIAMPDVCFNIRSHTRFRMTSVSRQGWNIIFMSLLFHKPLPIGCFIPEPW